MKKTQLFLSAFAMFGMLASCGGNTSSTAGTSSTKTDTSSVTPASSTKPTSSVAPASSSSAEETKPVETIFEHQFVFNAPGATYSEDGTSVDNTTTEAAFGNGICYVAADKTQSELANSKGTSKNGGPNYQLYINLLKEGNKVEAGRTTLYYAGTLANKAAFSTTGTWTKGTDGTYTINLEAFDYVVQGSGTQANEACTLTSDANGNIVWDYKGCQKVDQDGDGTKELVEKPYSTTLITQKSFAGEYSGVYYSITDFYNDAGAAEAAYDSLEVTALEDGTYTVKGCVEDSGISAFEGTITSQGVYNGTCARLDGTQFGLFYTDVDGVVKHFFNAEARERNSYIKGSLITD